eukprot:12932995-Prorocentrum_lima.AAC.1
MRVSNSIGSSASCCDRAVFLRFRVSTYCFSFVFSEAGCKGVYIGPVVVVDAGSGFCQAQFFHRDLSLF